MHVLQLPIENLPNVHNVRKMMGGRTVVSYEG
jgi:hypothetical protein